MYQNTFTSTSSGNIGQQDIALFTYSLDSSKLSLHILLEGARSFFEITFIAIWLLPNERLWYVRFELIIYTVAIYVFINCGRLEYIMVFRV